MSRPVFDRFSDELKISLGEAHIRTLQWLHRRKLRKNPVGTAQGYAKISPELVDRISRAYSTAVGRAGELGDSMWVGINEQKRDVHDALLRGGADLERILRNPGDTDFFLGFDTLFKGRFDLPQLSDTRQTNYLMGQLTRLAESIGTFRLYHPECGPKAEFPPTDAAEILVGIEERIGMPLEFPNPFPDELGLETRRGIAPYRALHAIHQAWRLYSLAQAYGGRVLEIGGGLGRTAYYAWNFGLRSYTIVDIPMTSAAQGTFLGQTLGPDYVTLPGEPPTEGAVRLLNPEQLDDVGPVDVVLNADSLTEMDRSVAQSYADFIAKNAAVFLSLNHEANAHRVSDLTFDGLTSVSRSPHWMRPGYVEELYLRA